MQDTQMQINDDARKSAYKYWGCEDREACIRCPGTIEGKLPYEYYDTNSCETAQHIDLITRQYLLDKGLPMKINRLYVIGPVTGIPNDNKEAFTEAREKLQKEGYAVFIPHDYISTGTPWEKAMQLSLNVLTTLRGPGKSHIEGIALLDGWKNSTGAMTEKLVAETCGMTCKPWREWLED